ncbi:MAG: translation initiation factor IF-2 [Candidatus Paceibacterota bacterium]|jgi:translation initiation factor IF-2
MTQNKNTEKSNLEARPPVVVIMGHIDHGKSTLLDYIRKTNTTEKEAGGITQHISAYEAECKIGDQTRKITFLDTPGHEAFCSIRARGADIADIAVLIVSAEDGVKPQTLEALNCINKDAMPFIIALNKIDRPGADIDKVKTALAEAGVLVEGWGGKIPVVAISGKTGEGVPDLLEIIALQSDIEELNGDTSLLAEGFVIESDLNPKQGISATLIIKNGSLKTGLFVSTAGAYAPVRAISNYKNESITEATFSSPIKIVGWNAQPMAGFEFKTFAKKEEAIEFAAKNLDLKEKVTSRNIPEGSAFLEVIVKADTFGSLNAVENELQKLGNEKMSVKIISKGIGAITEKDLKTATIKNTLVLGFNIEADKSAEILALRNNTEIKTYKIIYELIDYVKEKIKQNTPVETVKTVTGLVKIIRIFGKNKDKQVIGGKIEDGEIKLGSPVEIIRREALIGTGKIKELQVQKIKTDIVKAGSEFGMMLDSKIEIAPGDMLQATSLIKQE